MIDQQRNIYLCKVSPLLEPPHNPLVQCGSVFDKCGLIEEYRVNIDKSGSYGKQVNIFCPMPTELKLHISV